MASIVIFESITWVEILALFWHKILLRRTVYILEPFHAFHHRLVPVRFFQKPWTNFIHRLVANKIILVITAKQLQAAENYPDTCEWAIEHVESLAEKALNHDQNLFRFCVALMGEETAERVFKTNLVNQLAEYYSVRNVINHLQTIFSDRSIVFYPSYQIGQYVYYEHLLQDQSRRLHFSFLKRTMDRLQTIFREGINVLFVGYHVLLYLRKRLTDKQTQTENFLKAKIGVVLLSWDRQLENHQKSLSFLVDKVTIRDDDIAFFCTFKLSSEQKKILAERAIRLVEVKETKLDWSDIKIWLKMLFYTVTNLFNKNDYLIKDYLLAIKNFLIWKKITPSFSLKNFVTHADFGVGVLGRNQALNMAGVQTWYFTDSVNQLYNFSPSEQKPLRHPFYCYLNYDHLVTWTEFLAKYFQAHPGSFKTTHVVGCLWADYIVARPQIEPLIPSEQLTRIKDKFVIAAFDSTYSCNGLTSYEEGLAFAEDIIKLADTVADVCILWREKKKRSYHLILDGLLGPQLLKLYEKIDQHPRIVNVTQSLGSGEMISLADLTVSFPYTSTTFEALSARRQAIWHDASGFHKNSFFVPQQTLTHSFTELTTTIAQVQKQSNPQVVEGLPAYKDPYQDHGAIDRFRKLLTADLKKA